MMIASTATPCCEKITAFDGLTTSSAYLHSKLNVEMIDALLCLVSNIPRC